MQTNSTSPPAEGRPNPTARDGQAPAQPIKARELLIALERGFYATLRTLLHSAGAPAELIEGLVRKSSHIRTFGNFPAAKQYKAEIDADVKAWLDSVLPADDPSRLAIRKRFMLHLPSGNRFACLIEECEDRPGAHVVYIGQNKSWTVKAGADPIAELAAYATSVKGDLFEVTE